MPKKTTKTKGKGKSTHSPKFTLSRQKYLESCQFHYEDDYENVKKTAKDVLTILKYIYSKKLEGGGDITRIFQEGYLQKAVKRTGTQTYSQAKSQCQCGAIDEDQFKKHTTLTRDKYLEVYYEDTDQWFPVQVTSVKGDTCSIVYLNDNLEQTNQIESDIDISELITDGVIEYASKEDLEQVRDKNHQDQRKNRETGLVYSSDIHNIIPHTNVHDTDLWNVAWKNGMFSICGERKGPHSNQCASSNLNRDITISPHGWNSMYCLVCGYALETQNKQISFNSDHILPIGPAILLNCINTPCNYAPIHSRCNGIKSNYLPVNEEGWNSEMSGHNIGEVLVDVQDNNDQGVTQTSKRWQIVNGENIKDTRVNKYSHSDYNTKHKVKISNNVNNPPGYWEEVHRRKWFTYRLYLCALDSFQSFENNPSLKPYQLFQLDGTTLTLTANWQERLDARITQYKECLEFANNNLRHLSSYMMLGSNFDITVKNSIYNTFIDTIINKNTSQEKDKSEIIEELKVELQEIKEKYVAEVAEKVDIAESKRRRTLECINEHLRKMKQERRNIDEKVDDINTMTKLQADEMTQHQDLLAQKEMLHDQNNLISHEITAVEAKLENNKQRLQQVKNYQLKQSLLTNEVSNVAEEIVTPAPPTKRVSDERLEQLNSYKQNIIETYQKNTAEKEIESLNTNIAQKTAIKTEIDECRVKIDRLVGELRSVDSEERVLTLKSRKELNTKENNNILRDLRVTIYGKNGLKRQIQESQNQLQVLLQRMSEIQNDPNVTDQISGLDSLIATSQVYYQRESQMEMEEKDIPTPEENRKTLEIAHSLLGLSKDVKTLNNDLDNDLKKEIMKRDQVSVDLQLSREKLMGNPTLNQQYKNLEPILSGNNAFRELKILADQASNRDYLLAKEEYVTHPIVTPYLLSPAPIRSQEEETPDDQTLDSNLSRSFYVSDIDTFSQGIEKCFQEYNT